jgi:hypothetical protein
MAAAGAAAGGPRPVAVRACAPPRLLTRKCCTAAFLESIRAYACVGMSTSTSMGVARSDSRARDAARRRAVREYVQQARGGRR